MAMKSAEWVLVGQVYFEELKNPTKGTDTNSVTNVVLYV